LNAADPSRLKATWFQPLSLQSEKTVSSLCFQWQLVLHRYIEVLKYAVENGCEFNEVTAFLAAYSWDLDALIFLREHACPWNSDVLDYAMGYEHVELLLWARNHGCPDPTEYYWGEVCTTIKEYRAFLIRIGVPAAELDHLQAIADNYNPSDDEW
jgi:hypothetical protein